MEKQISLEAQGQLLIQYAKRLRARVTQLVILRTRKELENQSALLRECNVYASGLLCRLWIRPIFFRSSS